MNVKKKNKKKLITNILVSFVFVVGLLIMLYPQFSRIYYRIEANEQVADFDREKNNIDKEEIDRRMKLAFAFNDSLNNVVKEDPYSREMEKREGWNMPGCLKFMKR